MKSRKIAFSRKDKTTDEQKSCTSELIILNQAKIFGGVGIIGARWRMRLIWPEVSSLAQMPFDGGIRVGEPNHFARKGRFGLFRMGRG